METNRIAPALLRERLDPKFYGARFVEAAKRVADTHFKMGQLEELVDESAHITYGIVQPGDFVAPGDGVRLIRAVDFRDGAVDAAGTEWVSREIEAPYARARVQAEDYLVTIAGTVGEVALAPAGIEPANLNQSVARLRFRKGAIDPAWVLAFHRSSYGRLTLLREQRGSIQQHLNIEDIGPILVPLPMPEVQRYIGDKVRQAERLRERARRLEAGSSAFFQLPEWTEPRAGTRRTYTALRVAMRSERLDAPFYDPGHEDLDSLLRRRSDIELSEVASLVEARWTRGGDKFSYFEIGELDIASGILTPTLTEVAAAASRAQILVEPWDVLVSTVRPNRKNVGLVLPSDDGFALVASTGFAVLRFENAESAAFYHSFLRSDAATQQLMRWNSGATYPAIESDVPLRVRAPRFDGEVVQRQGRRWLKKFSALSASRALTLVATTLVEHLIDGRVTQPELVASQKALEGGDRSADREILKALRQSDAPDSKRLIADVNTLYALLDESGDQDA